MKTSSRSSILPFAFSLFAVVISGLPPAAHAFGGRPGGPFSNGSYFPNDGTFSAVVRGPNLIGTLQFSTTQGSGPSSTTTSTTPALAGAAPAAAATTTASSGTGGVGSTGVATIYFNGDTFRGNSQGALNPEASNIAVSFQADAQGQGEQTIEVQTPVTTSETTNVINPLTGQVTPVQTTQTQFVPTRQITYFDSLYINGVADCKTSNAFPNQKFQGSGQAEFQQLVYSGATPFFDAIRFDISITGVRLSNTASSFNTDDVRPPSVNAFSVLVQ
jgi:hypothetical protein